MDFLEDLALYDLAMNNAFEFITQRKTLEELYSHMEDVLDMLIEHFTHYEEYEKCAVLVKIKNQCLKKQIE